MKDFKNEIFYANIDKEIWQVKVYDFAFYLRNTSKYSFEKEQQQLSNITLEIAGKGVFNIERRNFTKSSLASIFGDASYPTLYSNVDDARFENYFGEVFVFNTFERTIYIKNNFFNVNFDDIMSTIDSIGYNKHIWSETHLDSRDICTRTWIWNGTAAKRNILKVETFNPLTNEIEYIGYGFNKDDYKLYFSEKECSDDNVVEMHCF